MDGEVELICDGDGIAVLGPPSAVERFLNSEQLASKELGLPRLSSMLSAGSTVSQAGAEVAANSGRWIKLTKESAQLLKKFDPMKGSSPTTSRAVVTQNGQVKGILEFARTPGAMLTNPAVLAGAAGLMAQMAMQQAMDEIAEYLAVIDTKLDDVLRAQKDSVLADLIGVDLVIDEAMTIRDHVGSVSDVSWSKVQGISFTIARTQAYALRQLDGLAQRLERTSSMGDVAKATHEVAQTVQEWLAVLAHCFQLQEAVAMLELDRVLGSSPDELERHRLAVRAARDKRLDVIARSTEHLLQRMDAAAATANTKVLLHPRTSPEVVRTGQRVSREVIELRAVLGIDREREAVAVRRWVDAAADVRSHVLTTGADGVSAARSRGNEALGRTRLAIGRLSSDVSERARRSQRHDGTDDSER